MKTNITLLLPIQACQKKMGKLLADKLDMFFADIMDLLEFELADIERILSVGGKEYLEREENKLVKNIASYSNTLITVPFDIFMRPQNYELLKKTSFVVYLQFSLPNYIKLCKKEKINFELEEKIFLEKDILLKKASDLIVVCENTNKKDIIKTILIAIQQYYERN